MRGTPGNFLGTEKISSNNTRFSVGDEKKLDFFKTNFPKIWEAFSEFLPDMI